MGLSLRTESLTASIYNASISERKTPINGESFTFQGMEGYLNTHTKMVDEQEELGGMTHLP